MFDGLRDKILGMFEEVLEPIVETYSTDKDKPVDCEEIRKWIFHRCDEASTSGGESGEAGLNLSGMEDAPREELFTWIMERVGKPYIAQLLQSPQYRLYDPDRGGGLWAYESFDELQAAALPAELQAAPQAELRADLQADLELDPPERTSKRTSKRRGLPADLKSN